MDGHRAVGDGDGQMPVRWTHCPDCLAAPMREARPGWRSGMTFTEVIVAAGLLLVAIVPILRALTTAQATSTIIEQRTRSLALAQGKLDEIRARCIYHYEDSFDEDSASLDGHYLCTVADDEDESLRLISVSAGYDENEDGNLSDHEVAVTVTTYIARRESGA
jgi:hypothetical protein